MNRGVIVPGKSFVLHFIVDFTVDFITDSLWISLQISLDFTEIRQIPYLRFRPIIKCRSFV